MFWKKVSYKLRCILGPLFQALLPFVQITTLVVLVLTYIRISEQVERMSESIRVQKEFSSISLRPFLEVSCPFEAPISQDSLLVVECKMMNWGKTPAFNVNTVGCLVNYLEYDEDFMLRLSITNDCRLGAMYPNQDAMKVSYSACFNICEQNFLHVDSLETYFDTLFLHTYTTYETVWGESDTLRSVFEYSCANEEWSVCWNDLSSPKLHSFTTTLHDNNF